MSDRVIRDLRWGLLAACLAAAVSLGWWWPEVAAELQRDRRAAAAYAQGSTALMAGRYDAAAAAFREVIAISPVAVEAYGSLAQAEFKRGRTAAAVAAYRRLLAIYPYTYIGVLYREVGVIELRGGKDGDARRDLQQAVALDPTDWLAHHFLGHAYHRLGDTAPARAAWRRVIALNPRYEPAHEQLRGLDGGVR